MQKDYESCRDTDKDARAITSTAEIQDILFELLIHFKTICDRNGLTYFLANGTLLGARKYGDFIPWDDDADLFMPRADYEKLMKLEEIHTGRFRLLAPEITPDLRIPYAKLIDTRTVLEESGADFGAEMGIFLDIFPIDNWSPIRSIAKLQAMRMELWKRMLICSNQSEFVTAKTGVKRWILYLIWRMGHLLGNKRLMKTIRAAAEKYNRRSSPYCGCVVWAARSSGEVLPRHIFEGVSEASLRGVPFQIPQGCDVYLSSLYGAWEKELPEAERHSNHNFKIWRRDYE